MPDDDMASEREFNARNIEEFRNNGGKVGGQFEGFPLLLLTSEGAKSGAERVNLRAHPDVQVEIGSDPPRPVTANELPRDERDRVIPIFELATKA